MFRKMQINVAAVTFRSLRLSLPLAIWSCHVLVAPAVRLCQGLAAVIFGLIRHCIDRSRMAEIILQARACRHLSLRGVKRRGNLKKTEVATPPGLAMTCQQSNCISINYSELPDSRPGVALIKSIPRIWGHGVKQPMGQGETPNPELQTQNYKGFTLIELIVTMVIIGILAATVLPRINFGSISSQTSVAGAANMVRSDIRYVQEWAMADRTSKQIQFTQNSPTYSFAPAVSLDPTGRLPSGVTTTTTITFTFNSLGEPSTSSAGVWTVSVSDGVTTTPITITQYTGEVAY